MYYYLFIFYSKSSETNYVIYLFFLLHILTAMNRGVRNRNIYVSLYKHLVLIDRIFSKFEFRFLLFLWCFISIFGTSFLSTLITLGQMDLKRFTVTNGTR